MDIVLFILFWGGGSGLVAWVRGSLEASFGFTYEKHSNT